MDNTKGFTDTISFNPSAYQEVFNTHPFYMRRTTAHRGLKNFLEVTLLEIG